MTQPKAQLPLHDVGAVTWKTAATPYILLCSFLQWADDARASLFGYVEPATEEKKEMLDVLSILNSALSDWVIRSSKVMIITPHKELVLDERNLIRRGLSAHVSTRFTNIGNKSFEVEHDVVVVSQKKGSQTTQLAAIISSTVIPVTYPDATVTPISFETKEFLQSRLLTQGMINPHFRIDLPLSTLPMGKQQFGRVLVRKSDCDGFNHVNNCLALNFFTSALSRDLISQVKFLAIEYPFPLRAEDDCRLNATIFPTDEQNWCWFGELCVEGDKRKIQAHFSSTYPFVLDNSKIDSRLLKPAKSRL